MSIIYKVTNIGNNPENGKCYIGFSKRNLKNRKREHLSAAKKESLKIFHKAIKKWGFENFSWKILAVVENSLKETIEVKAIKVYNTLVPNGYNSTTGGEGGKEYSEETKRKMSERHPNVRGKNNPNFGKRWTDKQRKELSDKIIGRYSGSNNPMFGIHRFGENSPRNKYYFICSNDKDYWKDFTKTERQSICRAFGRKKSDKITYKGYTIIREQKGNKNEFS
jgi:group I intron endonuclease